MVREPPLAAGSTRSPASGTVWLGSGSTLGLGLGLELGFGFGIGFGFVWARRLQLAHAELDGARERTRGRACIRPREQVEQRLLSAGAARVAHEVEGDVGRALLRRLPGFQLRARREERLRCTGEGEQVKVRLRLRVRVRVGARVRVMIR